MTANAMSEGIKRREAAVIDKHITRPLESETMNSTILKFTAQK